MHGVEKKYTWRELSTKSVTDEPPKSNTDKFAREETRAIPPAVTPVYEMYSFSKVWMDMRCLSPESVNFKHLERSTSFKFNSPVIEHKAELVIL